MENFLHFFLLLWKPTVEIFVFWFASYLLFVYIKDSGMIQALKGLVFLIFLFLVAQLLNLTGISWVLSHLFQISILGFFIIFQPELRRGLTRIGQAPLFKVFSKEENIIEEIIQAVRSMSRSKVGALIAIEGEAGLKSFAENGVALDAKLTAELLMTIFMSSASLHDGGVIIQTNRVMAAGCVFPLSESQALSRSLGTRHRAALGLSEVTDAFVIVVSEETGTISVANSQKMTRGIDEMELRKLLIEFGEPKKNISKKALNKPPVSKSEPKR